MCVRSDKSSTSLPLPRGIDPVDRAVLTFTVRWLPYGGAPADEVFVEFGLTGAEYEQRVCDLVHQHASRIHPHTVEKLLAMCSSGRAVRPTAWVASASGA